MSTSTPPNPTTQVVATLHGNAPRPWVTLVCEATWFLTDRTLTASKRLLDSIDGGLQIVRRSDGLAFIIEPQQGVSRARSDLFRATRNLTTASQWNFAWGDDPSD